MKIEEDKEKKKEIELAEKKIKEYKETLRSEKRRILKEKFDKINFFPRLKPWARWNLFLTALMIILFLIAYNHNPHPQVNEENKVGGFLSNIFGFLSKDNVNEDDINTNSTFINNVTEDADNESTESSDSTSGSGLNIVDITPPEETDPISFDMYAEYNGQEFSNIKTSSDNLIYYLIIEDKEDFDIKCEGDDYKDNVKGLHSNFEVKTYDKRSIYTKVLASGAGNDNKTVMKHEFTCYNVDDSIDDGTEKQITVTITFE